MPREKNSTKAARMLAGLRKTHGAGTGRPNAKALGLIK